MPRIRTGRRARFTPLALTTVLLSAGLLSLSMTGTLSGFTAAITNSTNTAATGTLVLQETGPNSTGATVTCTSTDGGSVSTNTATCATINKFGGSASMAPGATVTTSVTMKNTGSVSAGTFTLTPGSTCSQTSSGAVNGSATDLCSKLSLVVMQGSTQVYSGTLAALAGTAARSLTTLTAGTSSTFTFAVTLDSTVGNTYQGLQAAMPMTWTLSS